MKNFTELRFPRCSEVLENRDVAMLHLMNISHAFGKPAMVNYFTDDSKDRIDTILTVGTNSGTGKENFSVISTGQFTVVWDVVDDMPDISDLVNGEVYLYNDLEQKKWFEVYSIDGIEKTFEEVTGDKLKIYQVLKTNLLWVSNKNGNVRCLNEDLSQEMIDKIIEEIEAKFDIDSIKQNIEELKSRATVSENNIIALWKAIEEIETKGESIRVIAELHSTLEAKIIKIKGEEVSKVWFDDEDDFTQFDPGDLEFDVTFVDYKKEEHKENFDYITLQIDGLEYNMEKTENNTYINSNIIEFPKGQDKNLELKISVSYESIPKDTILSLYRIIAPKYFGRLDNPEEIDVTELTKESEYIWGQLKEKYNTTIPEDTTEKGYFVYMYPAAWGDLSIIENGFGIFYENDGKDNYTFKLINLNISGIPYNAYIYQNSNKSSALGINLK